MKGWQLVAGLVLAGTSAVYANDHSETLSYVDLPYGFAVHLPDSWRGYSAAVSTWVGSSSTVGDQRGPVIVLKYPASGPDSGDDIVQLTIMVFTLEQWGQVLGEDFRVSAAPVGPEEMCENSRYVIALPPRWTFHGSGVLAGLKPGDDVSQRFKPLEPRL